MLLPSIRTAIIVGLVLRLLAAVFSPGYAMHDDHFVIEDGPYQWFLADHGGWFNRDVVPGHSVVYPGILYGILSACIGIGITDPQTQMLVMRILHALLATLAIPLAAAIARRIGSEESAKAAAFLVAVFWVLPFLGVRNLIEVVCIPPLMTGVFLVLRRGSMRDIVLAGLAFAVAFLFRYHTAVIPATMTMVLMVRREWRMAIGLVVSYATVICLTQGIVDLLVWGQFLIAPITYWMNFVTGSDEYANGPLYQYVLLLVGLLIPPTSLVLLWRLFTDKRSSLRYEVLLPIVVFVVAHSFIANKQERFIIPVVPLLLVVVAVAWIDRPQRSSGPVRWTSIALGWFWAVNTVLLTLFIFSYSKRSRVESLSYLHGIAGADRVAVIAKPGVFVPSFYLGHEIKTITVLTDTTSSSWGELSAFAPTHVVFYDITSRDVLLQRVNDLIPGHLTQLVEVEPGLLDATLHWLNPRGNKNETSIVYEVTSN
ncbi:MAG: DUF2079 domain-containing protein [Ignavibacteria bacterium]|nr:DUF2079 domain-containing protein [Ignavibacteria bacterium]